MENIPGVPQSYPPPPPPPPQRSRKSLWIGLAIAAVILCICCVLTVAIYYFRTNIPIISSFFPSPTPAGLFYNNPNAGISLTYPLTWKVSESGDSGTGYTIIFASSQSILDNVSSAPTTGGALAVLTKALATSKMTFTVDATSMPKALDYIATQDFTNLTNGQGVRALTVGGLPAASGIYTMNNDPKPPSSAYLVAVLRNTEIILFFGVCPQTELAQNQAIFESMVNSSGFVVSLP
jgi:hypothetical protein